MRNLDPRRARWIRVRMGLLCGMLGIGLGGIVSGAYRVQVEDGDQWFDLAERQRQRRLHVQPKRGTIFDRNGAPLAESVEVPSVSLDAVELLRGIDEIFRTIVAIGSHDLVLDLAASALRAEDPLITLASSNVGSLGGLVALRDGLCHIAGSHLLDPATGEYTLPYLDRILPGAGACVVRLVHRDQGLIVAPGNPLGLAGIEDLTRAGVRYVNRQRGAGTRVLLDHELGQRGISPGAVDGYAREEPTHLAVAAAVAARRADAGLGIMAAARAFGLDFVPVTREPYDLVVAPGAMESPLLAPLWALLDSDPFRAEVAALGGYATEEMGRRIR